MIVTRRFEGCKASASYTSECPNCGKALKRTVTVEHTVNPFNRNEDGEVKSRQEVYRSAQAAADAEAASKAGSLEVCRNCDDTSNRAQLLAMSDAPDALVPEPERYWNSPLHFLVQRKQVERAYESCGCGAPCCSGSRFLGYRLTEAGKRRAEAIAKATNPNREAAEALGVK